MNNKVTLFFSIPFLSYFCTAFEHILNLAAILHGLFVKYGKIIPVYISVDEENKTELWKKSIENFQLKGYHLRASQTLLKEIEDKIFAGKGMISVFFEAKIIKKQQPGESDRCHKFYLFLQSLVTRPGHRKPEETASFSR